MEAEDLLREVVQLRKAMLKLCDKVDEEEVEECEFGESLRDEIKDFWWWAVNIKEDSSISKDRALKNWKRLHPDLPIPRAFTTKRCVKPEHVLHCLMFDALPHYLQYKATNKN